ncbi:MAG TPA: glycoside hydrolase family 76 protein [Aldersonia sp.]
MVSAAEWARRADAAEAAILARHVRRLWSLPDRRLGVVGWPAHRRERAFMVWDYWWQAHLIDCAVDAAVRAPSDVRTDRVADLVRGVRTRNITGWTNALYDDMAWLAIALNRADALLGLDYREPLAALTQRLYTAWAPQRGGGIPWRVGSNFYNAPANGPAGIVLARTLCAGASEATGNVTGASEATGDVTGASEATGNVTERATAMADWLDATLRDPESGLILDGVRQPGGRLDRAIYTYCQGVVLGLETELAKLGRGGRHCERVARLVDAVADRLAPGGVIVGAGGGDGGLFGGILARYLALVATELPDAVDVRERAAALVTASAEAAWENRREFEGGPLFSTEWTQPAQLPERGEQPPRKAGVVRSSIPERDLSVQLSGWMVLEAAYRVAQAG